MSNLKNITINIYPDRVVKPSADTILVPGHSRRKGHGGVFGSVESSGMRDGGEALDNWHHLHLYDEPAEVGSVLRVPAGSGGNSKHLSHVITVCDLSNGAARNFSVVAAGVATALEEMHERGALTSINIPLMGTGQMGWLSSEQSARAMMIGIDRFAKSFPEAKITVNFCMVNEERAAIMRQVLAQPALYTDIPDQDILNERGQVTPPAADLTFYSGHDPLLNTLRFQQSRQSVDNPTPKKRY